MRLDFTEYGYTLEDQASIVSGAFPFDSRLPVSRNSFFGDAEWNYLDDRNKRLKILNPSALLFNWEQFTIGTQLSNGAEVRTNQKFVASLPLEMIEDLRRAFFLIGMFPVQFARCGTIRGVKANTLVAHIRQAVNFFSHIRNKRMLPNGLNPIKYIQDLTLADIQMGLDTYPYSTRCLKRVLLMLSHELAQKNLSHGYLQWHTQDLKAVRYPAIKPVEPIEPLPEALFALLSNKSCDLVEGFLGMLGKGSPQESQIPAGKQKPKWAHFPEMFEEYVERRRLSRAKRGRESNHTKLFLKQFGVAPEEIQRYVRNVQCAAQNIILLYTGMRYSEIATIEKGCLIKRDGIPLIQSTLIKNRPANLPVDDDEWVASSAVVDAVRTLEEISRCTFNNFLVSSFNIVREGGPESPMSRGGFAHRLNEFLRFLDLDENWTGWLLSTHQYRHGLVNQLARAEVGLPYITRQLKHIHLCLRHNPNSINQTSIIYGQQREHLLNNATGIASLKNAKTEIIKDLYGQGRRFAGGGAALHIERTEGFFRGIGLQGEDRDKYLEQLAESNVMLVRTGVGWCTRNHVDPQKLKEAPPPCIGDLNCNPHTCKHSVVPEGRKADVIEQYLHADSKAKAADQTYLRSFWESSRDSFGAMLRSLGVSPEKLIENHS